MNSKNIILFLLVITALFSACDDFLEQKSQDKIIPKTTEQMSEFLLGELIIVKRSATADPIAYLPFLTDDVADYLPVGQNTYEYRDNLWGYYTWQADPEKTKSNQIFTDNAWDKYYQKVFICNIILDKLPDLTGADTEKIKLEAETRFMRALSYYMLVNLYGEPYETEQQAKAALGVPINNEISVVNKRYNRSSLWEVYNKIDEDLSLSIGLFKKIDVKMNISRPNLKAAYLLASRVELYKKNYKGAKDLVDKLIRAGASLVDLNSSMPKNYIDSSNPEVLFAYGFSYIDYFISTNSATYIPSDDLFNLYSENDRRMDVDLFFTEEKQVIKFREFCSSYGKAFRTAEAYLIRAECLCYMDDLEGAKKDLEKLRENRMPSGFEVDGDTFEVLLQEIKDERRRELCFEYHRWFDLRRYGMPELKHEYTIGEEAKQTFILSERSPSYTLQVPTDIRELNPFIELIERPSQTNN